jgi:hypothetical protein
MSQYTLKMAILPIEQLIYIVNHPKKLQKQDVNVEKYLSM